MNVFQFLSTNYHTARLYCVVTDTGQSCWLEKIYVEEGNLTTVLNIAGPSLTVFSLTGDRCIPTLWPRTPGWRHSPPGQSSWPRLPRSWPPPGFSTRGAGTRSSVSLEVVAWRCGSRGTIPGWNTPTGIQTAPLSEWWDRYTLRLRILAVMGTTTTLKILATLWRPATL